MTLTSQPTTSEGSTEADAAEAAPTATRVLQRQILPADRDFDVLALYVDTKPGLLDAGGGGRGEPAVTLSAETSIHPDQVESRTAIRVTSGDRLSFGTYFNAFPASYWRRWTIVKEVTLTVDVRGEGAHLIVYKSTANGRAQRVDSAVVGPEGEGRFSFELSLKPFVDGGWYWYNVVAGDHDAVVASAEWSAEVPAERVEHGTADICITTMNRPDFCAKLLVQIGEDEALAPYLDSVMVMEQGTQKVTDSETFPRAERALGPTLRVIEQGNLGGSGGYARGQLESVRKGTATYALMMDDDVVCEPEGVIRAVTFGDLCRRPTIVGGHMFSLFAKSRLHSFGEVIQPWRFWWQSAGGVQSDWDFDTRNLRSTRWLHQRIDVDFNGWFMCLIPRQVMAEIGLSLPLFIKWDDSEYGLRARAAGYPTVTFPGAAVWHVPWTDKNDALDWQAYFHLRNRFIAALLHSQYPQGGRMVQESLNHTIAHLVSMQYSTVELRLLALEDVLAGPDELHATLPTKLQDVNALRKRFTDARLEADRDAFPAVRRSKPPRKGREEIPEGFGIKIAAALMPLRHLRKPRELSRTHPETEIRANEAKWYKIGKYDSAVVSMNDGTSAALYRRDPARVRDLAGRTAALHLKVRREWPRLAEEYRAKLEDITSPEAWAETFGPWTTPEDDA